MTVAPGNLGLGPSCGLDGGSGERRGPRFFCADVTKLRGITFSKLLHLFSPQDVTGGSFLLNLELKPCFGASAAAEAGAAAQSTSSVGKMMERMSLERNNGVDGSGPNGTRGEDGKLERESKHKNGLSFLVNAVSAHPLA